MDLFRRVIRIFFMLLGFLAGLVTAVAAYMARRMISPPRQRLWATPGDLNVEYESVHFPAQDGIRLAGWFIPAGDDSLRKGATVVLVHGWPWNRLGESASDPLATIDGTSPVDLLRLAYAMHRDGFHVLMFDLRNHGDSASHGPVSFGVQEAKDLLGAIGYLNGRSDVDPERIGVVGFSMGANTLLYALPHTNQIKAGIAVQPTSADVYARGYANYIMGAAGNFVLPVAEQMYRMAGGLPLSSIRPAMAAAGVGDVPILYVQGRGDTWGSSVDVQQMADSTPEAQGMLLVDATHRFDGYQYVVDNPKVVSAFFEQHLPE
ncbi:MAG: alpha/beta fold hydrolase [Chloroflexi bacterium]|nr:MAG: alpha/beta fold hydrolase [Chloroflexota bacterium]